MQQYHQKLAPVEQDAKEKSPAAKRIHRTVMEALMLVYDEDKKAYNPGYSDNRVATETGAAPAYVSKTREDYFGPISEPAEIVAFRERIDSLEDQFKITSRNYVDAIASARADLALLRKNNLWK